MEKLAYSQNFFKSESLVQDIVSQSSISSRDIVYEIGPGGGVITSALAQRAHKVIAIEADVELVRALRLKFENQTNIQIESGDFLSKTLPKSDYKVFSNIPFNITAACITKLLDSEVPPTDSYLVVQREAALKFAGKPQAVRDSLVSVLAKPWFEFEIIREFNPQDFTPSPRVRVVLLRIQRREIPLLAEGSQQLFRDFAVFLFNRSAPAISRSLSEVFTMDNYNEVISKLSIAKAITPSQLTLDQWLRLFRLFESNSDDRGRSLVFGAEQEWKHQQMGLHKVHRTRIAPNWQSAGSRE